MMHASASGAGSLPLLADSRWALLIDRSGHPEGAFTAVCSDDPPHIGSSFMITIRIAAMAENPDDYPLDEPAKIVRVSATRP